MKRKKLWILVLVLGLGLTVLIGCASSPSGREESYAYTSQTSEGTTTGRSPKHVVVEMGGRQVKIPILLYERMGEGDEAVVRTPEGELYSFIWETPS